MLLNYDDKESQESHIKLGIRCKNTLLNYYIIHITQKYTRVDYLHD